MNTTLRRTLAAGAGLLAVAGIAFAPQLSNEPPPDAMLGGVVDDATDRPPLDEVPVPIGTVEHETLTEDVTDPTSIEVADDGRVVIGERTGRIKVWHQDGSLATAGRVPVAANQCYDCITNKPEEGGLHGLLLAKDFLQTGTIYTFYSAEGTYDSESGMGEFHLATWTLDPTTNVLDPASKEVILTVPTEWKLSGNHYGGDMEWYGDTILLATGDNTVPFFSDGYSPHDQRPDHQHANAMRTSQNPADRRGKLLRINPDGTVPADNPFVGQTGVRPDTGESVAYDPYVYAMGFRNNYRFTMHSSDTAIVGVVGPDAYFEDANRGPAGHDEVETVPAGGGTNHGWPMCIADNQPYVEYDFATGETGEPFDCSAMEPADIFYPYAPSQDFPAVAAGTRAVMPGVVYEYDGGGALRLPDAFQDRLIVSDWARSLLWTAPVGAEDGAIDPDALEVLPLEHADRSPIDMEIGPDGAVYLAEYGGSTTFYNNPNGRIGRLKCLACQPDDADYGS